MEKENGSILSDKWIYFHYELQLYRPDDKTHEEFLEYCENLKLKILNVASVQMVSADGYEVKEGWFKKSYVYRGSLNKNLTTRVAFNRYLYTILLRFNEITDDEHKRMANEGIGHELKLKTDDETREYGFSPNQFKKIIPITYNIEYGLMRIFGFKQNELFVKENRMLVLFEYDENKNPIITETDGIAYCTYPFQKRVELYLKYPNIEKEIFGGFKFKDFVNWIYSKKNKSNYDKKFCLNIEKIMKKYGQEL